jgi:hypothetical protein
VVPKHFALTTIKVAEGLGRSLNDFSTCCLTVETRYAINAKGENKEVLILLRKYLGTSVLPVYISSQVFRRPHK